MHLTGLQQIVALRERLYGATPQDWMSKGLSWYRLSYACIIYFTEPQPGHFYQLHFSARIQNRFETIRVHPSHHSNTAL